VTHTPIADNGQGSRKCYLLTPKPKKSG
jgi:hypothetical protein